MRKGEEGRSNDEKKEGRNENRGNRANKKGEKEKRRKGKGMDTKRRK